ncbi:TIGR03086 family metal-binding protein [Nocardia mikamii]|uniref:TIGR03086 family metal-binding protein n=1 Tax=Nocardia mikamii TaxID=508464 RepID=UPI0007A48DD4|nr:TIGR03086 family metal-binding protein [Nocardia mikamii]
MTTPIDHIDAALDATTRIVAGLRADLLATPSLCPGWDLRFELNHLVGGMRIFAAALCGTEAEQDHHDEWLGCDPHAAFATAAELDRAAWHRPDALSATVRLGFGAVPAPLAAQIHRTEILVHGIDLAVVAGLTDRIDDRQSAELLATMRAMDFDTFRRPGMFAAAVPAPAQAPPHRQLLAFLGRDVPGVPLSGAADR